MPHFVTSAQDEPHVLSANDARLMAGIYGNGEYVLPICNRMAATMVDTNTIRIMNGDALTCGRHWSIDDAYEEYDIENGTPGMKRIDLVVARIETAPSETIKIIVYKGEEVSSNPVVPAHISGDLNNGDTVTEMPLYTVPIDGINPDEPIQQFRVSESVVEAWDSLSQNQKTLLTTLPVQITFGAISAGAAVRTTTPLTVPEGYRPIGVIGVSSGKYETTINRATMSGYTLDIIFGNPASTTITSGTAVATILCMHQ